MKNKPPAKASTPPRSEADELAQLNAENLQGPNAADRIRRTVEATIEANSKRKRQHEEEAAGRWKPLK